MVHQKQIVTSMSQCLQYSSLQLHDSLYNTYITYYKVWLPRANCDAIITVSALLFIAPMRQLVHSLQNLIQYMVHQKQIETSISHWLHIYSLHLHDSLYNHQLKDMVHQKQIVTPISPCLHIDLLHLRDVF